MRALLPDLEPFRVPAFRRYVLAATVTSVSLWSYQTGLSWTLLQDSGSAAVLGLLFTAMTIPLPFASIPGGMLTDRLGPRGLMAIALLVEAACILATGLLALTGNLTVPLGLLLAVIFGAADGTYVVPAQVFVGRVVEPRAMRSAISLSMLSIGVGRIVGGLLGGFLVALGGAGAALVPAAIGVGVAVATIRTLPRIAGAGGGAMLTRADLAAAATWVRTTPAARGIFALGAVSALFLWPYLGLLAVVVRDHLGDRPTDLGVLTAAGGIGAIVAALGMASVGRDVGAGRLITGSLVVAGGLQLTLATAHALPFAASVALLLAVATVTHTATTNTLLQSLAPTVLRGRALALYGCVFYGLMPVGTVVAGTITDRIGVAAMLTALGVATILGALGVVLADRRLLRQADDAAEPTSVVVTGSVDPLGAMAGLAIAEPEAVNALPDVDAGLRG